MFDGARVVDLGSGGGIPGLVIAERCPSAHVFLLDGRRQRTDALRRAVTELGWPHVDVIAERAEEAGRDERLRGSIDVVVARGFGPPPVVAECAAPLLRVGGWLVVSEPPGATEAAPRWPEGPCATLGLRLEEIRELPWSFAVLRQEAVCPERFPRRVGVPAKRPLF